MYAKDLLDRSIDSKLGLGSVLATMTTLGAIAVAAATFLTTSAVNNVLTPVKADVISIQEDLKSVSTQLGRIEQSLGKIELRG